MGTQPKSKAVEAYRRQIAAYLDVVRVDKGWKNVEMGQKAGGLAHTTIARARKGEHTLSFPALLALEAASGIPIPAELKRAAIAAQQPPELQDAPSAQELRRIRAEFERQSPEAQKALLAELQKAIAKAG